MNAEKKTTKQQTKIQSIRTAMYSILCVHFMFSCKYLVDFQGPGFHIGIVEESYVLPTHANFHCKWNMLYVAEICWGDDILLRLLM